jgi:RNA polymerase sigma-70 factor (sigma-E family)
VTELVAEPGELVGVSVEDRSVALAALFTAHYTQLLRAAALLLGDVPAAEDAVQEAFIRVDRVLKRSDITVGVGYLQRTVVNLARSDLRRRVVAMRHAPKPMPDAPGADHGAIAALENDEVVRALRTLPRRQREAVVIRHYLDQSEPDTAALMGVSVGAVKAYASRGLAALRIALEDQS